MSRLARTERLADLYEEAAAEMEAAIAALEACDKPRAEAAMARVMSTMNMIGEALVSGPILPLIPVH